MPSEAEFMRLARLECIFGATVKYQEVTEHVEQTRAGRAEEKNRGGVHR